MRRRRPSWTVASSTTHAIRVLDMAQVTFIDSSGLKVIVIANRARDASDRITLRAPSRAVRRVVDIAGMAEWLGLAPDPSDPPD